jgi:hypothetical protein
MLTKPKPPTFKISDWLPDEEALARVHERWGDRDLALGELNRELLNGRLKSVLVLLPRTGRREHAFLPPGYWRTVRLVASTDSVQLRLRGLVGDPVFGGHPSHRYLAYPDRAGQVLSASGESCSSHVFIRRAEFDVLYPPTKPAEETETIPVTSRQENKPSLTVRVAGIDWARRVAKQMKADGAIPEGITQRGFAKMIEQRMQEEAAADPSLGNPLSADYIRSHLKEWGLWPLEKIK